jgi:hypothetical protein
MDLQLNASSISGDLSDVHLKAVFFVVSIVSSEYPNYFSRKFDFVEIDDFTKSKFCRILRNHCQISQNKESEILKHFFIAGHPNADPLIRRVLKSD